MGFRKLTNEDLEVLKQNSLYSLPDNPSDKGISASQIKTKSFLGLKYLFNLISDVTEELNDAFELDENETLKEYLQNINNQIGNLSDAKVAANIGNPTGSFDYLNDIKVGNTHYKVVVPNDIVEATSSLASKTYVDNAVDGITTGFVKATDLATTLNSYLTTANFNIAIANYVTSDDLTASLADYASKTYVDNAIAAGVSKVYKAKGSVSTYADLPNDAEEGDVYDVTATGDNYVWIIENEVGRWDKLGTTIDMSSYYTSSEVDTLLNAKQNTLTFNGTVPSGTTEVDIVSIKNGSTYFKIPTTDLSNYYNKTQVDTIASGKVDVVSGKGLSTNDYTTSEKNKLAAVNENAQVNVIESIRVNEVTQEISNKRVDLTIPTKMSDLQADMGYLVSDDLSTYATKSYVQGYHDATKQNVIDGNNKLSYSYISGTPTIPTKVSDLTNDLNFIDGHKIYELTDNDSNTAGSWLFKSNDIVSLSDGMLFVGKTSVAGATTTYVTITNKNNVSLGQKIIYRYGTTKLTTQYPSGSLIMFYYDATADKFRVVNDYDTDTNSKVREYQTGTSERDSNEYPILARYTNTDKSGSYDTNYTRYHTDTYINTSTGEVVAPSFKENGTALSSKYLGINAKASDSTKLNGQEASYYTNYNNLSNKPTIPTALSGLTDDSTHRLVTDTEKSTWSGKQNALTFDSAPTENSSNPVTSDGIYDAITEVRAVAEGKTRTYVCSYSANSSLNSQNNSITVSTALKDVDNNTIAFADLKVGDVIYVTETDVPDRWVYSHTSSQAVLYKMETAKVPVSDVKINGTSVISNNQVDIITNTAYDSTSNKIATMNDLTDFVTTDTTQSISGEKTTTNKLYFQNSSGAGNNKLAIYNDNGYNAKIKMGSTENIRLLTSYTQFGAAITPITTSGLDLGHSSYLWKDLYLSGNLTDGTNSISIANIVAKQNALTTAQLNAVNSGITSSLVTQITTNKTNIASKQDALTTAQLNAVNSGITSSLVTQIGTNTSAIAGKQASLDTNQLAAVNSGITSTLVGKITTNETNISGKQNAITWNPTVPSGTTPTAVTGFKVGSDYYSIQGSGSDTSTLMTKANPTGTGYVSINRRSGTTIGNYSVAMGQNCTASGNYSSAFGTYSSASGNSSFAAGYSADAKGTYSVALGCCPEALGNYSFSAGSHIIAFGANSIAMGEGDCYGIAITGDANATTYATDNDDDEIASGSVIFYNGKFAYVTSVDQSGNITVDRTLSTSAVTNGAAEYCYGGSFGNYSFSAGYMCTALGYNSYSLGNGNTVLGTSAFALGNGLYAKHKSQFVFGEYNAIDSSSNSSTSRGTYVEIVGKGTNESSRSNARTLDWNGNEVLAGTLTANGGIAYSTTAPNAANTGGGLKIVVLTSEPATKYDGYLYIILGS